LADFPRAVGEIPALQERLERWMRIDMRIGSGDAFFAPFPRLVQTLRLMNVVGLITDALTGATQ